MFWEIHPTPADKSFKQISRYNAGPYSAYGVLDHDCTDSAVLLCVELQVVVSQILNSLGPSSGLESIMDMESAIMPHMPDGKNLRSKRLSY